MCPYIFVCLSDYFSRIFLEKKLLGKEHEYFKAFYYLLPNCFLEPCATVLFPTLSPALGSVRVLPLHDPAGGK